MTTIIRRYRQPRRARVAMALGAAILLAALAVWGFAVIWAKGGPQRLHQIVIALPAPKPAPHPGRRA